MATNYCAQCGEAVSAEDRFCPACGASITEGGGERAPVARRSSRIPVVIVALAAIGLLLIAGGLFLDSEDEPQAVVEPPAVPETARPDNNLPFPDVPRIALDEAHARQMAGEIIFVDVRDTEDYVESHIPDALSIPLDDTEMDPAYRELPEDAEIVIYCT